MPFFWIGLPISRLLSHYEEMVYFFALDPQRFLVFIWSNLEEWKAKSTLQKLMHYSLEVLSKPSGDTLFEGWWYLHKFNEPKRFINPLPKKMNNYMKFLTIQEKIKPFSCWFREQTLNSSLGWENYPLQNWRYQRSVGMNTSPDLTSYQPIQQKNKKLNV